MKYRASKMLAAGAAAAFAVVAGIQVPSAQQAPAVKPTMVMKQDIDVPGREVVMSFVELPAGSAETPHTHAGELFVFVREGEISLESEGKPTAPYKTGDVFYVASGKIHRAINNSNATARTVAVFVAEKGKPLTTPTK